MLFANSIIPCPHNNLRAKLLAPTEGRHGLSVFTGLNWLPLGGQLWKAIREVQAGGCRPGPLKSAPRVDCHKSGFCVTQGAPSDTKGPFAPLADPLKHKTSLHPIPPTRAEGPGGRGGAQACLVFQGVGQWRKGAFCVTRSALNDTKAAFVAIDPGCGLQRSR